MLFESGWGALKKCHKLTSVTIPNTVTIIREDAFYNCPGLTDVYYDGTSEERSAIQIESGNSELLNAQWHYGYVSEKSESLETVGDYAGRSRRRFLRQKTELPCRLR